MTTITKALKMPPASELPEVPTMYMGHGMLMTDRAGSKHYYHVKSKALLDTHDIEESCLYAVKPISGISEVKGSPKFAKDLQVVIAFNGTQSELIGFTFSFGQLTHTTKRILPESCIDSYFLITTIAGDITNDDFRYNMPLDNRYILAL